MKYTILLSFLLAMAIPAVSSAQIITTSQRTEIETRLTDIRVAADQETLDCRMIGRDATADLLEQVSGRAAALIVEVTQPGYTIQELRVRFQSEMSTLRRFLARHPNVGPCEPWRVRALLDSFSQRFNLGFGG
jgi:hypothetical protein